jgi:hypothetical protein
VSLASLGADLLALSEAAPAPQSSEALDTRPLARAAVDYVLSEADGDVEPEDIGVAIALAAGAAATEAGAPIDDVVSEARTYLSRILSGTEL